jgi:hypothetical protein
VKQLNNLIMKQVRILASILFTMIVGLVMFALMGLMAVPGVLIATGSVVAGGTVTQQAATGGDSYDESEQYLDMRDVQRKVEEYKPYQTPLLTLLSQNSVGSTDSWEKKYYAVDARELSTTVSAATTIVSDVSTLTVADASLFTKQNTLLFTGITTSTTKISEGRFLVGLLLSKPSSTSIEVQFLNPGNALAAADLVGKTVYRSGSALNETAASTTVWGVLPETDYNYIQIFMEQVEESEYQKIMKKEADWGMADLKRMAIEDFKLQRERTFLGGLRGVHNITIDGDTKRVYTCGGFLNDTSIPMLVNQDLSAIGASSATFVTWLKTIFTGNNGSKIKFALCGADLTEAIEKVHVDNKFLMAKDTKVEYGIDWVRMVSAFGILNIKYYEQMDLMGKDKWGIVVDKTNILTADLKGKGFNVRKIDKKSSGIANVDSAVIEQSSTMLIKNKDSHHIIQGV